MNQNLQKLLEERISKFSSRLKDLMYETEYPLQVEYAVFKDDFVSFKKRKALKYKKIKTGDKWGKNWQRAWFNISGKIPKELKGKHVVARIDLGGEALLFDEKGVPKTALSIWTMWENYDFRRDRIEISEKAKGNEKINYWLEASAGQLYGINLNTNIADTQPEYFGLYEATLGDAVVCVFRKDIWDLYVDFSVLFNLMKNLPDKSVRRSRILKVLNDAVDTFDLSAERVKKSTDILKGELSKPAGASELTAHAVGHAHIDTAWLWPLEETIRKCARTFTSQINNIEKYPGYIFGASQPQHFYFLKEYYPELYKKVKEKIKQDRIELQGGMWVEADCNLISGESMIRQILHGKNFFLDEFGIEVDNLWLPDVFGYSAALPQILKKSNIHYFVTQKISWSQFNKFPNNTFIWQGIDGSEVITHFPPEDNYNSELLPQQLMYAQENFKEKAFLDEFLVLFGIGDGGGGATEEIIECGLRQRDLENVPKVKFGPAKDMLNRLNTKKHLLPKWVGELYLEYHRGTLTTHAFNKKMNRRLEFKLREVELLFSLLPLKEYPAEELDKLWKTLLLNQFHDIIPGSSITAIYERSQKDLLNIEQKSNKLINSAARKLFKKENNSLVIFNTLSYHFKGTIDLPVSWKGYEILFENEGLKDYQNENDSTVVFLDLAPFSGTTIKKGSKVSNIKVKQKVSNFTLENDLVLYRFSANGTIDYAFDKEVEKEIFIPAEQANLFSLYEDRPVNWDAWDVDIYYENQLLENAKISSILKISEGSVRSGYKLKCKIGNSEIEQNIYLNNFSKRLDFETFVNWNETHKMLRVSFPINIRAESANFDIQYGYVNRPTHRNTSWDMAKFEVCAHKYADLSDNDYGVALLNNAKYGHKVYGNTIDLNILRSPTSPDPKADRGKHEFIYSLLPHTGSLIESAVLKEARCLNEPPLIFDGFSTKKIDFSVSIDNDQVVIETLKKAEKEDCLIIRLYESLGRSAKIQFSLNQKSIIIETDLMEKSENKLKAKNNILEVNFNPFEIKTFKIFTS